MSVNEDSKAHRSAPIEFALEVINYLYGHYFTPEDSLAGWDSQLENGMWWADDALYCLQALLDNPPDALGERIRQATENRLVMSNYGMSGPGDPTDQEYLEWVRDRATELDQRFGDALASFEPETIDEEDVQWASSPEEAKAALLDDVPFWATNVSATVEDASGEWGDGAWTVRLIYTLTYT